MTAVTAIDIVFDVICPWCYIGKRRLERALAARPEVAAEVYWRPFLLNPDMPAEGMERGLYLTRKFGGAERASRVYEAVSAAGALDGIAFAFDRIPRTPSTVESHRLARYAHERGGGRLQDRVVEALFRAYFVDGRDIGARDVLLDLAEASGLAAAEVRDYLDSGRDIETIHAENLRAHRLGINGVPCFTVNAQFAVAGAQEPAVFLRLFDLAAAGPRPASVPDPAARLA